MVLKARNPHNAAYRLATGLGLATAFLLVWVVGAVGIFGEPDFLELASLVVGGLTALIGRFEARALALSAALFSRAAAPKRSEA